MSLMYALVSESLAICLPREMAVVSLSAPCHDDAVPSL